MEIKINTLKMEIKIKMKLMRCFVLFNQLPCQVVGVPAPEIQWKVLKIKLKGISDL